MDKPRWGSLNFSITVLAIPAMLWFPPFQRAGLSLHSAPAVQLSQTVQPPAEQLNPLESLMQAFNRRRAQREGIRRSGICVLSPSVIATDIIWSDRPLFIWQGVAKQIQLAPLGRSERLWEQPIEAQAKSVRYDGSALQPGEIYQWELWGESNTQTSLIFQVMEPNQRAQIAAQLQAIESQLTASGATPEAIALRQAQFFADQNLWSDALQLLYAIEPASPPVMEARQQIEASICGSESGAQ